MARSEFSQLRGMVQKRLSRLESAGLVRGDISLPMAKDLTSKQKERAVENFKIFLQSGTTVKEVKRSGRIVSESRTGIAKPYTERQIKRREAAQHRRETIRQLTPTQQGMLKTARKFGLTIQTADIESFIEYMEYRFNQVSESQFYVIATYMEDYENIQQKKPEVTDIKLDFERYVRDRGETMQLADSIIGNDESSVMAMWDQYINSD